MIAQNSLLFNNPRSTGDYLLDASQLVVFSELEPEQQKLSKQTIENYKLLGVNPPEFDFKYPDIGLSTVVDTEFRFKYDLLTNFLKHSPREALTTQMMQVHQELEQAIILAHQPHAHTINAARVKHGLEPYPIVQSDLDLVDFLHLHGFDADIHRDVEANLEDLPVFEHTIYGHFLLAELFMIHRGEYATDLLGLICSSAHTGSSISMNRRLTFSSTSRNGFQRDRILLPWVLTIEGIQFRFSLSGFDTGALHGIASFADLLEATGLSTDDKLSLTKEDKMDFLKPLIQKPAIAEAYSVGDLLVYQALVNNANNFHTIYKSLGVPDELHKEPKMTIGATVYNLFTAVLRSKTGLVDNKRWEYWSERLLTPTSASYLRERGLRTTTLMAKVQGGRCRNNRPNLTSLMDVLADLDIDGAYGEGQRNQALPFGRCESLYDYDLETPHKHYYTLRESLKLFGASQRKLGGAWNFDKCELVPGLFFMLVSSTKTLVYPQDYFCSWYAEADASKGSLFYKLQQKLVKQLHKQPSDSEREASDQMFDEEDGELKIHLYEIINGVLTWDGLQWILNVCSPKQREELLDNLQVNECLFYSRVNRVDTPEQVIAAYENWNQKTTASRVRSGKRIAKRVDDGECHIWCAFNLGELIIDSLLCNRKLHAKGTPMNTLYKLCVNTLYGDMVSKYFTSANVVVGNNITARCRALAWYMEHGLNGLQTITDGCAFSLNSVAYPHEDRRKLNAVALTQLWCEENPIKNRQLKLAPLGFCKDIQLTWVEYTGWDEKENEATTFKAPVLTLVHADNSIEVLEPTFKADAKHEGCQVIDKNPAKKWVDKAAFVHLQHLFPDVDVLHKKTTAVKPLSNTDPTPTYEERVGQFQFETKDLYTQAIVKGTSDYCLTNPNENKIKMRSHELKRQHIAMDGSDDYQKSQPGKQLIENIRNNPHALPRLKPAIKDGILKPSDFSNRREYYLKQGLKPGDQIRKPMMIREFSLTQFTFQTRKQYLCWKTSVTNRKLKYGQSIEAYFCNPDGTLDFETMVKTVAEMVKDGIEKPFDFLDKHRNIHSLQHPWMPLYTKGKQELNVTGDSVEFVDEEETDA